MDQLGAGVPGRANLLVPVEGICGEGLPEMAGSILAPSLPSEGTHWYSKDGQPQYFIIGANGVERPTTLRDARKHGWLPSVTTITACAARWGLEKWKAEQLLMAGLTLPKTSTETEPEWLARVWADSKAQAEKAAQRGTEIHAAVETYYRELALHPTGPFTITVGMGLYPWVESISRLLEQSFGAQDWLAEKSFASPLGYGGKVDLHSSSVLVDFKGKEKLASKGAETYDEHHMQLAAYAVGLDQVVMGRSDAPGFINVKWPTAAIVFFDRDEPYSECHIVKPADLERGWEMFRSLLGYWQAANRYKP